MEMLLLTSSEADVAPILYVGRSTLAGTKLSKRSVTIKRGFMVEYSRLPGRCARKCLI